MNQEVEVLKEQAKKIQREKDVKTSKIIIICSIYTLEALIYCQ